MIIGITGTDGAGKGEVVKYLVETKEFQHYSARELISAAITKKGLDINRANMRLVANDLRRVHGNEFIVSESIRRAQIVGHGDIVIESIRTVAEADYLKKEGGILLAVDANQMLRFERIQSRASESDKVTFEEFKAHEELEMNDPDPNGMQKAKVMEMADYTIMNDGSRDDLYLMVDSFLSSAE